MNLSGLSDKPIIACSTGLRGNTAIKLVRISGFENLSIFQSFFPLDLSQVKPRYNYLTKLMINGEKIDEVVITFYQAPKSYNGENILEIALHGNLVTTQYLIESMVDTGLVTHARAGEFTLRALKNKKLTLSQVEGLDALINSNSIYETKNSLKVLNGEIYESYEGLFEEFKKLRAAVEMQIDFAEDIGEQRALENFSLSLRSVKSIVDSLLIKAQNYRQDLINPEVVLVGPVNAGKSSLFNELLSSQRAIVSSQKGTTRDYVSENIYYQGTSFKLIDTAGFRETSNEVERAGIENSKKFLKRAFYKILVINPMEVPESFYKTFKKCEFDMIVATHMDMQGAENSFNKLEELPGCDHKLLISLKISGGPIEPEGRVAPIGPKIMSSIGLKFANLSSQNCIGIERHRELIVNIHSRLQNFIDNYETKYDIGIIDAEIRHIEDMVSELVGIFYPDEILNSIFSNFCIGK